LHHFLVLLQPKEKLNALTALSFVEMLHEFVDVRMAEFLARIQAG
jgi:hypothetical protein